MHERSLARALLRQVEALAVEHGASRVLTVRVQIGEFSGVEAELLKTAFDELAEYTVLRGVALVVKSVPLEAVCQQCGETFCVVDHRFQCAVCGSVSLNVTGGEEMLLETVTMEGDNDGQQATCGNAAGNPLPA